MWVIVSSDGDIDYTDVYGPYATQAEAEADLPEDNDDLAYRVNLILSGPLPVYGE